ncbi:unnamed protein product [Brassica rapa subsp. trilocularis]
MTRYRGCILAIFELHLRWTFKKLEDVISQTFRAPLVMDLPISIYIM